MSEPSQASNETQNTFLSRLGQLFVTLFDVLAKFTEKVIGLLRLLAISTLFLVVLFVVYRAIQSSGVIDVKPFTVPKSMLAEHNEAGRIVSNILKSALRREESNYILAINGIIPNMDAIDSSIADQQLDVGGDIKIPQTGISINDVVEFISSIFGKQSITGSVFEDDKTLYLQLVLKGRVFSFETPLVAGKSRIKLLEEMLQQQSSKKILSVAFQNYNLYYYCNGEVDSIEKHNGKYQKWFDYCQQSRELDSKDKIHRLQKQLASYTPKTVAKDKLIAHTLTQLNHLIDQKVELINKVEARSQLARTEPAPAPVPESTSQAVESPNKDYDKIDKAMRAPAYVPYIVIAPESPSKPASPVEQLKSGCETPPNPQKSSTKDADGTLLYKLQLYEDAIKKYEEAIQADCNNAKAWANLGILYTLAYDARFQDTDKAIAMLTEAARQNPSSGWIQHQLCIAQSYASGVEMNMENALKKESCEKARELEPANAVLYDKLFYLALADRYYNQGDPQEAFPLYLKSMEIDKRADCHMYEVIARLKQNYSDADDKIKADQAICRVLKQAYFIEEQPDGCHDNLKQLQSSCH